MGQLLKTKLEYFDNDFLEKYNEEIEEQKRKKILLKIETTRNNLINCGNKNIIHKLYCKKCKAEGKEALLLEEKQERASCTIKYCKNPHCVKTRYAITTKRLYETFFKFLNENNKKVWRKIKADDDVMHCSISPEPIYIKDVKQTKKKVLSQINHLISVLNKGSPCPNGFRTYMKTITKNFIDGEGKEHKTSYKLRFYKTINKRGKEKEILVFNPLQLRGIKVFDIKYYFYNYYDKKGNNLITKILPHYHLAIIPNNKKDFIPIALIQHVRKQISERSRNKTKTHLQFHLGDKKNRKENLGYKPAKSVITYMTKRAIGAFGKSDKYREEDLDNKKIETIFEDKGIYGYQDIIKLEGYMEYFHNQKTISYFGREIKRLYINNDMTFIKSHLPLNCAFCGELNQDQIEYSRSEELIDPPPPQQRDLSQFEDVCISVEYFNPLTSEKFKGNMKDIRINEFKKELEKQKAIIPHQLFRNNIWQPIQKLSDLPPIEEFECQNIKDMKTILRSGQSVYEYNQFHKRLQEDLDKININTQGLLGTPINPGNRKEKMLRDIKELPEALKINIKEDKK